MPIQSLVSGLLYHANPVAPHFKDFGLLAFLGVIRNSDCHRLSRSKHRLPTPAPESSLLHPLQALLSSMPQPSTTTFYDRINVGSAVGPVATHSRVGFHGQSHKRLRSRCGRGLWSRRGRGLWCRRGRGLRSRRGCGLRSRRGRGLRSRRGRGLQSRRGYRCCRRNGCGGGCWSRCGSFCCHRSGHGSGARKTSGHRRRARLIGTCTQQIGDQQAHQHVPYAGVVCKHDQPPESFASYEVIRRIRYNSSEGFQATSDHVAGSEHWPPTPGYTRTAISQMRSTVSGAKVGTRTCSPPGRAPCTPTGCFERESTDSTTIPGGTLPALGLPLRRSLRLGPQTTYPQACAGDPASLGICRTATWWSYYPTRPDRISLSACP